MSSFLDDGIAIPTPVKKSLLYRGLTAFIGKGREAVKTSILTSLVAVFGRWMRKSWVYRWLTKEPEPEVIVIDLRDTLTVGPLIVVLDWIIAGFRDVYKASALKRFVQMVGTRFHRAPIRYLSLSLLPILLSAAGWQHLKGTQSSASLLLTGGIVLLAILGLFVDVSWPRILDSRPAKLLLAVFEPPEPPDSES